MVPAKYQLLTCTHVPYLVLFQQCIFIQDFLKPGIVVGHVCSPSILEDESGELPQVEGQAGLQCETQK